MLARNENEIESEIEPIFGRLPVGNCLDLSNANLTNDHIPELVEYLEKHSEITTLDISFNNISDKGAQALATLGLIKLDASNNKIRSAGAQALATKNNTLKELDLGFNFITDEDVQELAQHPKLNTLGVAGNDLTVVSAKALAQNPRLVAVDVSVNNLGSVGAKEFAESKTIKTLKIGENGIRTQSAKLLLNNPHFIALDLSTNDLTADCAPEALANKTLVKLSIWGNPIFQKEYESLRNLENCNNQIQADSKAEINKSNELEHKASPVNWNSDNVASKSFLFKSAEGRIDRITSPKAVRSNVDSYENNSINPNQMG